MTVNAVGDLGSAPEERVRWSEYGFIVTVGAVVGSEPGGPRGLGAE